MWSDVIRELGEQLDKEFLEHIKSITNERVMPALSERQHVEQQAKEEIMQLSEPVKGEPEV